MSTPHDSVYPLSTATAVDSIAAFGAGDDGDDWLGYEGMHPLTWLPAPTSMLGGVSPVHGD